MLTEQGLKVAQHEAHHLAIAVWLDLEIIRAERKDAPGRHGVVEVRGTVLQRQAFLIAPFLAMCDDPDFDPAPFVDDLVNAKKLGSVGPAVRLFIEARQDPRYRLYHSAAWKLLRVKLELSGDDIAGVRDA